MTASIYEKARKNRILALCTVAARNAAPQPAEPVGFSTSRGPKLHLVSDNVIALSDDDRIVA